MALRLAATLAHHALAAADAAAAETVGQRGPGAAIADEVAARVTAYGGVAADHHGDGDNGCLHTGKQSRHTAAGRVGRAATAAATTAGAALRDGGASTAWPRSHEQR